MSGHGNEHGHAAETAAPAKIERTLTAIQNDPGFIEFRKRDGNGWANEKIVNSPDEATWREVYNIYQTEKEAIKNIRKMFEQEVKPGLKKMGIEIPKAALEKIDERIREKTSKTEGYEALRIVQEWQALCESEKISKEKEKALNDKLAKLKVPEEEVEERLAALQGVLEAEGPKYGSLVNKFIYKSKAQKSALHDIYHKYHYNPKEVLAKLAELEEIKIVKDERYEAAKDYYDKYHSLLGSTDLTKAAFELAHEGLKQEYQKHMEPVDPTKPEVKKDAPKAFEAAQILNSWKEMHHLDEVEGIEEDESKDSIDAAFEKELQDVLKDAENKPHTALKRSLEAALKKTKDPEAKQKVNEVLDDLIQKEPDRYKASLLSGVKMSLTK